ncbi:hypothetical protein BU17DRAFT_79505 [Hysterangium stoloniferum]|nr:hypothetical protein BU17DRAFT_79505 [Hysterangium stoloniferum]
MSNAPNSSMGSAALPPTVLQLVADNLMVTRTSAAAFAVMLFDISLTLDVEIQYIWRRNWSLTKVLYILSRYLGVFNGLLQFLVQSSNQPSIQFLEFPFVVAREYWGYSSASPHSHGNGPCSSNQNIAIMPYGCDALVSAFRYYVGISAIAYPPRTDSKMRHTYGGCRLTRTIAMYFGLAIYKVMKHLGERGLLRTLMTEGDGQNMVSIFSFLLRDTVLFYFSTLGVVLVNFMYCALFPDRFIAYAAVPFLVAAYSITGSRLILFLEGDVTNKTGVYKAGTEHRIDKTVDYEMMAMISAGSVLLDETKSERGLSSLPILESNFDSSYHEIQEIDTRTG